MVTNRSNYERKTMSTHPFFKNKVVLFTFPMVANRFDFGSNFASKISVDGFCLQKGFQQQLSKFQTVISFPALNNKSKAYISFLMQRLFFFLFFFYNLLWILQSKQVIT